MQFEDTIHHDQEGMVDVGQWQEGQAVCLLVFGPAKQTKATSEAAPVGDSFLLISALLKTLPPPQTEVPGDQMLKHRITWEDVFHTSLD